MKLDRIPERDRLAIGGRRQGCVGEGFHDTEIALHAGISAGADTTGSDDPVTIASGP
jgi:hypothetical protein